MNAHKFFSINSSIILIIFIIIGTGIVLAAFLLFRSSHTYPWIGMKFTFWIYHLIQQESTECFLNCPDSFRFDEVLFHIPNLSTTNKHQYFNLVPAWNQIQEIVTNVIRTSKFSCATLLVSLQKKVHVLTYVVSAKVGFLLLSQTLYIYIYTCYEIFMLFE